MTQPNNCGVDYGNATLAALPACPLNRLQSVLNTGAQSIVGLRFSEHITDALASFHWLRAPERIKFKLAVVVYQALHGTAPQYLSDPLQYLADLPTKHRGRLRSSTSSHCRRTLFCCCWPTTLEQSTYDVQSAPSLATFRQKLKTHLFQQPYPDPVL